MAMIGDIEAAAETLYKAAGFTTSEQAHPLKLAERLLGDGAVRTAPAEAMASRGALVRLGSTWRIYLNAGCDPRRKRFVLLHELAHWALPEATEDQCDRLAGALLLPRLLFLQGVAHRKPAALADCFGASESCCWLRLGEATGAPLALISPTAVRLRGKAFSWPSELVLRDLVGNKHTPGLRKARLRDEPNRAVLRAF